MKKVLKGILMALLLIIGAIGLIYGKEYIESKRIEHIVKGKIKTYKIDYNKVEKNPMGGINIYLTINDDPDMRLHTTLVRGTRGEKYKTGAKGISPKLDKLIYGEKQ